MFINDLPTNTTSGIKLFADDCVLYRPINSVSDHFGLQRDLDQLEKWAYTWQMKFAPTKCFVMSVTLKNSPSQFRYSLCNAQLDVACHQKYLGVYITCTLSWQLQCDEAKKKALRVLRIIQRNLSSRDRSVKARAYLSLVRPIVEYATVAWSPHTNKGIDCIESVQRRTEYETFEKQKIMPHALSIILGYLVCWSWHAYFKPKDQIIGRSHGATILNRNMKNETANLQPPPPPPPPPNHGSNRAKAKMHHFPILGWRGGGINFPSISYKHRRQPGGILNINYSRLRDEIPAPGSSVPRTLVKAKLRWPNSECQTWISNILTRF